MLGTGSTFDDFVKELNSGARDAWREIEPSFARIADAVTGAASTPQSAEASHAAAT